MIKGIGDNVLFLWVNIMGSKTYRSSVTQRLLDDENYSSSADYGMQKYIAERKLNLRPSMDSKSLGECVTGIRSTSMPVKWKQAYNRALDTDNYIFGVPRSSISTTSLTDTKAALTTYLETVEGQAVSVLYNSLNDKNPYHFGWKALYDDYLYSGKTNEIKKLSVRMGTPCYLLSSQMILTQESIDESTRMGTTEQYGLAMSYGYTPDRAVDPNREQPDIEIGDADKLIITYVYSLNNQLETGTETISLDDVFPVVLESTVDAPEEVEYMQAMYKVGDTYKLFTYEYMSGGIEEIDKATGYEEEFGHYYPRLYTRIDSEDVVERADDDTRKVHTENMMNLLGLDLDSITEQIEESIEDIDSSYKYIFMHLSISVNKDQDDQVNAEYLYNYFNTLYDKSDDVAVADRVAPVLSNEKSRMTQTITDSEYTQVLSYTKAGKSVRTGVTTNNDGADLAKGEFCVKYGIVRTNKGNSVFGSTTSKHIFVYQIGDNQYIELTLHDLRIKQIYQNNTVTAIDYDENLTVPLDITVVEQSQFNRRELLLNRAMQITVSTKKVIKEKWYESTIFKVVMAVISIGMNLIVPGSGLTLTALMEAVVVTVLTGLAIKVIINIAVEIAVAVGLSPELTAVITLILVAAGAMSGKIDFSKILDAKNLMEATNQAFNMYARVTAERIKLVQEKMQEFDEYAESEWDRLSEAQEMLNTGVVPLTLEQLLTPISTVNINLGETAEDFYTRSTFVDVYDLSYNSVDYFLAAAKDIPLQYKTINSRPNEPIEELLIT